MNEEKLRKALISIEQEMNECVAWFLQNQKYLEAERLKQRTSFDLEMFMANWVIAVVLKL